MRRLHLERGLVLWVSDYVDDDHVDDDHDDDGHDNCGSGGDDYYCSISVIVVLVYDCCYHI